MKNFRAIGRISVFAAATALVATSMPAFAAPNDPPAKEQTTKQDRKQKQQYCVQDEITGSRMPRKVCKTRAEWISEDGFDPLSQR
jgi:hypothetical protein